MSLNPKQKRFCEEYILDLNATQAAIRSGYSAKTAKVIGAENLAKPDIQQYLQGLQAEVATAIAVTRERVLKEYASIAFSSPKKILSEGMIVKDISELSDEVAAAIKKITPIVKVAKDGEIIREWAIEFHDKVGALAQLSKHLGLDSDFNQAREAFKKYGYVETKTEKGFEYVEGQ